LQRLREGSIDLWLGQSVDTSRIHTRVPDYAGLPVLTSIGCGFRRPTSALRKFDRNLREHVGAGGKLMVDSGGFALISKEAAVWNDRDVARIYSQIDADRLVSLDIPPVPSDDAETRWLKYDKNAKYLRHLSERFADRLVPVLHGDSLRELERNCEKILQICGQPQLLGLGGLVPYLQQTGRTLKPSPRTPQRRIRQAIQVARTYFPRARIHLFGVGSAQTVLGVVAMGATSIDSTGWRQTAGFGSVYVPGRSRRLLTDSPSAAPCRPFIDQTDRDILLGCWCPICRNPPAGATNIELLSASFLPRALHNIYVLYREVSEMLASIQQGRGETFIAARLSVAWCDAIFGPQSPH
jgi:tRNA-guanine family transglycosylase